MSQTRCGVDALLGTRWRIDALKQTRGRQMSLRRGVDGFLENEQSIFPYQISFPDEPQMQFLGILLSQLKAFYHGLSGLKAFYTENIPG